MLYERWQQIAQKRDRERAVLDLGRGERWTFGRLANLAHKSKRSSSPLQFPQLDAQSGQSGIDRFLLAVLVGWRDRVACCPLEPGQPCPCFEKALPRIAHLKTTSATTGSPRFVAFTEEQLAADCDNIVVTMELRPEWPNVAVISPAHSYGFSNLILPLLLHGIPIIVAPSPLPEAILKASATAPDITLPAVPALWRAWHDAGAVPPNARLAISAGAPLPLALEQQVFGSSGVKIHNFYGATECGGIAYDSSSTPREDASCVGGPMRNVRLKTNIDGCLEVRGPAVGTGYWPEPDANLGKGCFRTSDLAEIRDGLVYIRGRASDLINVAGRKVSPEIIERAVQAHPGVRDCLVFGALAPTAQRGEQIVACVVAQPGVTGDTLRGFLLEQLPAWQVPRDWRFVDSLAPNQRGKLSRSEWRARLGFEAGAASTSRP